MNHSEFQSQYLHEMKISRRIYILFIPSIFLSGFSGCIENDDHRPEATFTWEYMPDNDHEYGVVTVTHSGGDKLVAKELFIRGDGFTNSPSASYDLSEDASWINNGEVSGIKDGKSAVKEGDSIRIGVTNDYHLVIALQVNEGPTFDISEDRGPAVD